MQNPKHTLDSRRDSVEWGYCSIPLVSMALLEFTSGIPLLVMGNDSVDDLPPLISSSADIHYADSLCPMAIYVAFSLQNFPAAYGHERDSPDDGLHVPAVVRDVFVGFLVFCVIVPFVLFFLRCWSEMSELVRPSREGRITVSQRLVIACVRASLGAYVFFLVHIVQVSEVIASWLWWIFVPFRACALSLLLMSAAHALAASRQALGESRGADVDASAMASLLGSRHGEVPQAPRTWSSETSHSTAFVQNVRSYCEEPPFNRNGAHLELSLVLCQSKRVLRAARRDGWGSSPPHATNACILLESKPSSYSERLTASESAGALAVVRHPMYEDSS